MITEKKCVDYREFRLSKLGEPRFSHLKLLIYWPLYGLMFLFVERFYPVQTYHIVHSHFDDLIPFNELFLIPYYFWFVYLIGMHIYTLLYDTKAFVRFMKYIIITYTAAIVVYLVYPTCQEMRPQSFERDNILTKIVGFLYVFDTNTNVCPSIHVIGSAAVMLTGFSIERFRKSIGWSIFFIASCVLICISTVFLKQHSVIDIAAAIPVCIIGYFLCFRKADE